MLAYCVASNSRHSRPLVVSLLRTFSEKKQPDANIKAVPLRKVISPFLLMCHPDKIQPLYEEAKTINLTAVQTLNSFIDAIQNMHNRLANKDTINGAIIENKLQKNIEFMVPSSPSSIKSLIPMESTNTNSNDKKLIYTRRSVSLTIPSTLLRDIKMAFSEITPEENKQILSSTLMKHALHEIAKLLKSAGLAVPSEVSESGDLSRGVSFLKEEEEVVFQIDWDEEKKRMEQAVKRMEYDIATLGLSDDRRKRYVVSNIVGRVRFYPETVSSLDQLITLRRLSLLLMDEFDTLQIEDYGKLWENLVIVVVASNNDASAIIREDTTFHSNNSNRNRMSKKKKQALESGFKFSLRGDYDLVVSIPLSFVDRQFINEFTWHLPHFDIEAEF